MSPRLIGVIVRHHHKLSIAAAVVLAISLALLLRLNQAYVPTYQTFPAADWLEFTFGPDDATPFGSAESMAWLAAPLLVPFSIGVAEYNLPVRFNEPHLRRQVMGLQDSYALGLATPTGAVIGDTKVEARLLGRLEVRVFRNETRALSYAGLRAFKLDTTKGAVQVTSRDKTHKVWVSLAPSSMEQGVEAFVVGQLGPAAYEVSLQSQWEAQGWGYNSRNLLDRTQSLAETLATEWRRRMQEAWDRKTSDG